MNKKYYIVFFTLILCIFISGCFPAQTSSLNTSPTTTKKLMLEDLIDSEEATKQAQAGLAEGEAANECEINCTVKDNTWTYNYYYKVGLTKSNLTSDITNIWDNYVEDFTDLACEKFSSADIHLQITFIFNFYSFETNELLYNTSKTLDT